MHVSGAERAAEMSLAGQAKLDLYDRIYRPFTERWSAVLASSEVQRLVSAGARRDLSTTLKKLNRVFRSRVAPSVTREMLAEAHRLREHILWAGIKAPGFVRSARRAFNLKLQRNVSLGLLEALLCLESARRFAVEQQGMHGRALAETLRRSRQLYRSLAVLHDESERERIMHLVARSTPVEYPQVTFADVLDGQVRIGNDHFVVGGTAGEPQLRFVNPKVERATLSTPTMRCPAHQARPADAEPGDSQSINDKLWDLLINVYVKAGKFPAADEVIPIVTVGVNVPSGPGAAVDHRIHLRDQEGPVRVS